MVEIRNAIVKKLNKKFPLKEEIPDTTTSKQLYTKEIKKAQKTKIKSDKIKIFGGS